MNLGEIINNYRKINNLSLQDFAKLINSSRSYVHMIEKNLNPATGKAINPSAKILKQLATAMNITIDELLKQLNDDQLILFNEEEYQKQFNHSTSAIRIPVLGKIPAGIPLEAIEDVLDYEDIPISMCRGNKEYFGLKIQGNSMEPEYLNDDVIIFLKQDNCENGDDCVVMVNGNDATFKRVYKKDNGIVLQPLNNSYEPLFFSNTQIAELPVRILGVLVELRRKRRNNKKGVKNG